MGKWGECGPRGCAFPLAHHPEQRHLRLAFFSQRSLDQPQVALRSSVNVEEYTGHVEHDRGHVQRADDSAEPSVDWWVLVPLNDYELWVAWVSSAPF